MPAPRARFPLRTLLLMVLALLAFARMWCATHPTTPTAQQAPAPEEEEPGRVVIVPLPRPVTPDAGQP